MPNVPANLPVPFSEQPDQTSLNLDKIKFGISVPVEVSVIDAVHLHKVEKLLLGDKPQLLGRNIQFDFVAFSFCKIENLEPVKNRIELFEERFDDNEAAAGI